MRLRILLAAVWTATAVFGGETPLSALRFGFRSTQPDKWPEMRAALEKNLGAFDEVWFSTGVTFPSLAWHEEHARQCAAVADDLRKLGIVPSIEFQTIIGHGDEFLCAGDCSGQDWGTMVSADGLAAKRRADITHTAVAKQLKQLQRPYLNCRKRAEKIGLHIKRRTVISKENRRNTECTALWTLDDKRRRSWVPGGITARFKRAARTS